MDPNTLDPSSLALYQAIKQQYAVAFEPLRVGDHQLHILKMTDLEQLLAGKDPFKDVSSFPFWIKIWEAALVLAELLATLPKQKNARLLELGAGLGVPGLIAAAAGFSATLSDYEPLILDVERVNAAASKLQQVDFLLLDWNNPPPMPGYDVIVGAEILFRESFFTPLLQIMRQALNPGGVIYLAHDSKRKSLKPFLSLAEQDYVISASSRRLKSLEGDTQVLLTRLQPRS